MQDIFSEMHNNEKVENNKPDVLRILVFKIDVLNFSHFQLPVMGKPLQGRFL